MLYIYDWYSNTFLVVTLHTDLFCCCVKTEVLIDLLGHSVQTKFKFLGSGNIFKNRHSYTQSSSFTFESPVNPPIPIIELPVPSGCGKTQTGL